jgi:hypothetical protein
MDPSVVEAFAMLGDQRIQQTVLAGSPSLRSLAEATHSETDIWVPTGGEAAREMTGQSKVRQREAS